MVVLVLGAALSVALKATGVGRIEGTTPELGPLKVGAPAPDATMEAMSGGNIRLVSLRGSTVLLEFGATWCGPCRATLRPLRELQFKNAVRSLEVAAVDVGESADVVRKYYAARKYGGLRVAFDPAGDVSERFGVNAFPTLVAIDRAGVVRLIHVGAFHDIEPIERLKQLRQSLRRNARTLRPPGLTPSPTSRPDIVSKS